MRFRLRLASLLALSSLGLASSAGGQEAASAPASVQTRETHERARPRILHLATGAVVRARARLDAEGMWTWKTERGSGSVSAAQVVRVVEEAEALRAAERMRAELGSGPSSARRVELAAWLAGEGLVREALEELDRVLAVHPDDPRALELLGAAPQDVPGGAALANVRPPAAPPRGTPIVAESRLALISNGRLGTPSMRELVVRELASDPEPRVLFSELERSLDDSSAKRRSFAALALSRLFPGAALERQVVRAVFDHDADTRLEMARALARGGARRGSSLEAERSESTLDVEGAFLRGLGSELGAVRIHAAEALALLGTARSLEPLLNRLGRVAAAPAGGGGPRPPHNHIFLGRQIAYVMDYDVEIAQGASIADPIIGVVQDGSLLDVASYGVTIEREVQLEARALRRALEHVARELPAAAQGRLPEDTNEAWLAWGATR